MHNLLIQCFYGLAVLGFDFKDGSKIVIEFFFNKFLLAPWARITAKLLRGIDIAND